MILRFEIGSLASGCCPSRFHQRSSQPFVAVSGPPASSFPGAIPAQEAKCAADGNCSIFTPISALSIQPSFFYAGDGHQLLFRLAKRLHTLVYLHIKLRELAKQKGVTIARTKTDFLITIKEKHPGEDLERLKGKMLFDRVSELHISRLRSKKELQALLAKEGKQQRYYDALPKNWRTQHKDLIYSR